MACVNHGWSSLDLDHLLGTKRIIRLMCVSIAAHISATSLSSEQPKLLAEGGRASPKMGSSGE